MSVLSCAGDVTREAAAQLCSTALAHGEGAQYCTSTWGRSTVPPVQYRPVAAYPALAAAAKAAPARAGWAVEAGVVSTALPSTALGWAVGGQGWFLQHWAGQ